MNIFKHWYQRLRYGYTDKEVWDLFWHVSKYILPRLERLADISNGYPIGLTVKKWNKILDQMIEAFEIIAKSDVLWEIDSKANAKVKKGLSLFGKYFLDLWI